MIDLKSKETKQVLKEINRAFSNLSPESNMKRSIKYPTKNIRKVATS